MDEETGLPGLNEKLLFKYGKLGAHFEAVFTGSSVWFSGPRQLNDPFECRPTIAGVAGVPFMPDFFMQDCFGDKTTMYCVSRTVHELLLWSHYGDEHRGYRLAFSESELCSHFDAYSNVTYQDNYPDVALEGSSPEAQSQAFAFTKYSGWSYGRELRFISMNSAAGPRVPSEDE